MADWSLTSLQLKLIKIGARVVRHARPSPSNLPRWPSPVPWSAQSLLRSADYERHRYRVTAILTQTEQKRLDRPVCRAEKRGGPRQHGKDSHFDPTHPG